MTEQFKAQMASIECSMEVLRVQIAALKHMAETEAKAEKTAQIDVPERCAAYEPRTCGIQNDDSRIEFGSFADPHRWLCRGCGYDSAGAATNGG